MLFQKPPEETIGKTADAISGKDVCRTVNGIALQQAKMEEDDKADDMGCDNISTELRNDLDNSGENLEKNSTSVAPGTTTTDQSPQLVSKNDSNNALGLSLSSDHDEQEEDGNMSIMQKCIHSFQNFFHIYVTDRIFGGLDLAAKSIEAITLPIATVHYGEKDMSVKCRRQLSKQDINQVLQKLRIAADHLKPQGLKAFKCACQLLVDFASFPIYFTDFEILNKKGENNSICFFENFLGYSSML